jgi:hypothetical protein
MALAEHALTTVLAAEQRGSPRSSWHEWRTSPLPSSLRTASTTTRSSSGRVWQLKHVDALEADFGSLATPNEMVAGDGGLGILLSCLIWSGDKGCGALVRGRAFECWIAVPCAANVSR